MDIKLTFKGTIISINPRIRITRSFDEVSHSYLGYAITLEGELDNTNTTLSIGIGKAAHAKHQFKVNDVISGECVPVPDPDLEPIIRFTGLMAAKRVWVMLSYAKVKLRISEKQGTKK